MLYRHAHTLLEVEGYERDSDTMGKAFRVRPADHDAPDTQQSFVFWSTLTTRGEVPGEPLSDVPLESDTPDTPDTPNKADKPDTLPQAQLVLEMSADGTLWVALDPHRSREPARVVRIPFLLPFVRARVVARGLKYEARAVLLGSSPFSLHTQVHRGAVVIIGGHG